MLQHLTRENLHHTNICIGNRADIIADIDTLVSTFSKAVLKIERLTYEFDKFLLKDAEHIFSKHIHKVGDDEMQIITIACNFTNRETQNSMLKLLEEPPQGTYFFLIVPNKKVFLPTILSRAQIFEYKKEIEISKEIKELLAASYVKRFEFVKKLLDEVKDEKKTKEDVTAYIEQIEKHLHQKKNMKLLKRTVEIKDYLKDQGASMKQLLEYLVIQM